MARHRHSVWAMLFVAKESEKAIHRFLTQQVGLRPALLHERLHISVYHARRALDGLTDSEEPVAIEVPAEDLRFMAMTPGGENPRPEIDPARCHVGVRVKRSSSTTEAIRAFRSRFYPLETMDAIGVRRPSNHVRNAFGARHFQPHVTLIRPNNGLNCDLKEIGAAFRIALVGIKFDRLVVRCRSDSP
jgi:hypothetical protein